MDHSSPSAPVIVGIDGSTAGLRAALWAVDEAVSRDTPLRLVHVVPASVHDLDDAFADAQDILHKTWTEVEATGKPVKIESEILRGDPADALVEASRAAHLVCVGWKGAHDSPRGHRGSTAASVARGAACPVALVRRRHTHKSSPFHKWIIAVLDESPESHTVVQTAVEEALLRDAPVLALTPGSTTTRDNASTARKGELKAALARYLTGAKEGNADIQVCALPMPDSILNLFEQSHTIDQLVVVGSSTNCWALRFARCCGSRAAPCYSPETDPRRPTIMPAIIEIQAVQTGDETIVPEPQRRVPTSSPSPFIQMSCRSTLLASSWQTLSRADAIPLHVDRTAIAGAASRAVGPLPAASGPVDAARHRGLNSGEIVDCGCSAISVTVGHGVQLHPIRDPQRLSQHVIVDQHRRSFRRRKIREYRRPLATASRHSTR